MSKTIYFIHGAYSADKTWGEMDRVISEDREMKSFKSRYTSHTTTGDEPKGLLASLFGSKKKGSSISINDIKREIIADIGDMIQKGEDIYIVAHSLGGVALRYALLEIDNDEKEHIKKIIYLDTPGTKKEFNSINNIFGTMEADELNVDADTVEDSCEKASSGNKPYKEKMIYAVYGRKMDEENIPKCVNEYEILSLRHPDCGKVDGGKHHAFVAMKKFFLDLEEEKPLRDNNIQENQETTDASDKEGKKEKENKE